MVFDILVLMDFEVIFMVELLKGMLVYYGGWMVFFFDGILVMMIGDGFDYCEDL